MWTTLLAKLKYFVKAELLKTVHFAISDSILRNAVRVWEQHRNPFIKEIDKFQEKTIRIMSGFVLGKNRFANKSEACKEKNLLQAKRFCE